MLPKGGNWQVADHLAKGRVQVLQVRNEAEQAVAVLAELKRLKGLSDQFSLANTAILAREWRELDLLRTCFEEENIPVNLNWGKSSFPSLTRIREYSLLLQYLKANTAEYVSASTLLKFLPESRYHDNIWQTHLRFLIEQWREETNNQSQPVAKIAEYFYESLADQHRSRHLGNGIFLSTIHSVKGLEFDHVFVLGGSWREATGPELEEERRLFYVAMTRARETLQLFELDDKPKLHTKNLEGDFLLRRRFEVPENIKPPEKRYHILGMKDLYLGYAGKYSDRNRIHEELRQCKAGDQISFKIRNDYMFITNTAGVELGRLSKAARDIWLPKADTILQAHVLAMARWSKADISESQYADLCKCEEWEVPVCEVVSVK